MTTEQHTHTERNRRNAQKSTGPKTEAGKAVSRCNALKHGLTATTIAPLDAPGEPHGAFDHRLDHWVDDTRPRNVLEMVVIQRACRASWKLDRCARYEDAAASRRESCPAPNRPSRREEARQLGVLLMLALEVPAPWAGDYHEPNPYNNAPRDVDALASFKEGVEWLLDAWEAVLRTLTDEPPPPPGKDEWGDDDGADVVVARTRERARRLLGVITGAPDPAQPLRAAGEAEVRRLKRLHAEMSAEAEARLDADMALFRDGPEAQLLMRYEAQADRELHRAIAMFLRLRKDPDLVPPPPAPVAVAEPPAVPEVAAAPAAASAPRKTRPRTAPPARNEATIPADSDPPAVVLSPGNGVKTARNGSP